MTVEELLIVSRTPFQFYKIKTKKMKNVCSGIHFLIKTHRSNSFEFLNVTKPLINTSNLSYDSDHVKTQ